MLVHLILEDIRVEPVLVASLQGLASLETLYVRGAFDALCTAGEWDMTACTRLRRVFLSWGIATRLSKEGQDLKLPPACTAAVQFNNNEQVLPWLKRLGRRLGQLHFTINRCYTAAKLTHLVCAPQLSQLRHLTLTVGFVPNSSLFVAQLVGGLPRRVESLSLTYFTRLPIEQAIVVVPASLRALRVKAMACLPAQGPADITFGLHAGLERLCLALCVAICCVQRSSLKGGSLHAVLQQLSPCARTSRLCISEMWSLRSCQRCPCSST